MDMLRREPPVADPKDLADALRTLEPGQELIYHRGHLHFAPPEIRIVAKMARVLFEANQVRLHHRRLGPPKNNGVVDWTNGEGKGVEYVAIGIKPPIR